MCVGHLCLLRPGWHLCGGHVVSVIWHVSGSGSSFLGGSVVKNPHVNTGDARDIGLIPGLGRSSGEGNGNSLQYSCLEIPWTEEPGRLQSMGSQRVRPHWLTKQHQKQTGSKKAWFWWQVSGGVFIFHSSVISGILKQTKKKRQRKQLSSEILKPQTCLSGFVM